MKNSSATLAIFFSQVGHSMSHIFMLLYPTVVLALEKEFHQSYGELLVLMTLGNVLFGVAALPAGWLGDRWSTLGMMIIFFLGLGASAIFTGCMSSTGGLVLGLALIGLFASIYHPVGMAWLVKNAENKGRALGINGVFGSLGVATAALIAGVLTDIINWRAAFIVPGVIALLVGVALIYCVRRGLVAETFADAKPFVKPPAAQMKRVFIVLSFTMLLNGVIYQSVTSALPKILAEGVPDLTGGTATGAGALVSFVYFCAMGASLVGGYLSDRFSVKHLYIVTTLMQVPVYAIAATLMHLPLLFAITLAAVFNTIAVPTENVLLTRYTPERWRATAFGAKFVLALGLGALGVPLVAYIRDTTGSFHAYYLLLAAIAFVIAVIALGIPSEQMRRKLDSALAAKAMP
ncbi:MAG: MFS transporter [Pseudomonadota bacterium]|nr:MFS transporter [Pseudomonadota bacterium]